MKIFCLITLIVIFYSFLTVILDMCANRFKYGKYHAKIKGFQMLKFQAH